MDKPLSEFLLETNVNIASVRSSAAKLRRDPEDQSPHDTIFRISDNIKGMSGREGDGGSAGSLGPTGLLGAAETTLKSRLATGNRLSVAGPVEDAAASRTAKGAWQ